MGCHHNQQAQPAQAGTQVQVAKFNSQVFVKSPQVNELLSAEK
jgi:hypothetical protein